MASSISTGQSKVNSVNDALARIAAGNVFLSVGGHLSKGNDSVAATVTDTDNEARQVYSDMIGGMKLAVFNTTPMIDRKTWTSGIVVPQYEPYMSTSCYIVVESGGGANIYKCLDNNKGAQSTTAPSGTSASVFKTADGYVWKYISTVSSTTFTTYSTSSKAPLTVNTAIQSAAVPGTVDVVRVEDGGAGYANYLTGSLIASDIQVNNNVTFKLPSTANATNDFYNGCLMEITNPLSAAFGQARKIVDYDGTTKIAVLESAFANTPAANDTYEISPAVEFVSGGSNPILPVARAIISNSNAVSYVKVLSAGQYNRDTTGEVLFHPSVGVAVEATLSAVNSPALGHGSNPLVELGCSSYCVQANVSFASLGVPITNEVRTAALIDTPTFDNVSLSVTSNNPERFLADESVLQFKRKGKLSANVSYNSTTLTGTDLSELEAGDKVLIASGSSQLVITVDSVANTTQATGTVPYGGTITGPATVLKITGTGTVTSTTGAVKLTKATATFNVGNEIYGETSHALDSISAIDINGRGTFTTFIQATRLMGSVSSGTFAQDELITPSAADGSYAYLHSISDTNDQLFLTNQHGSLPTGNTVVGNTSSAVFSVTSKYEGDLNVDSGKIMCIKNVTPISMSPNKQLSVKFIFDV